jgi:hypothetical protein
MKHLRVVGGVMMIAAPFVGMWVYFNTPMREIVLFILGTLALCLWVAVGLFLIAGVPHD